MGGDGGDETVVDERRDEVPALGPGQRFRGLLIHSELGRGAMGRAYLASHSVLEIPLVIKTFADAGRDVLREAHLAARVRSPHVVDVLDAGFEDDRPFIIQRYVDGIDLGELVRRMRDMSRRLPLAFVVGLAVDVARGLHAIHQAGVVHRDVKPENLFLSGDGHALVGDFGIAVVRSFDPDARTVVAGTPKFLAPEAWRGEAVDARADIYALGATTHLLATGEPPFAGSIPSLALAHIEREYVPPRTEDPREAYLFTAIAAKMAKAPDRRPATALEVARLLTPIAAEPAPLVRRSEHRASVAGLEVELRRGDLAAAEADVLVNAANWQMKMDVGVARALRDAGGEAIEREAMSHAPAGMGDVVWTGAGALRTRYVAHAVAALAGAMCIQRCTLRTLLEAMARRARTVAFPALGTGVGEVPHALAAQQMLEAIATVARLGRGSLERIEVVLWDEPAVVQWTGVLAGFG